MDESWRSTQSRMNMVNKVMNILKRNQSRNDRDSNSMRLLAQRIEAEAFRFSADWPTYAAALARKMEELQKQIPHAVNEGQTSGRHRMRAKPQTQNVQVSQSRPHRPHHLYGTNIPTQDSRETRYGAREPANTIPVSNATTGYATKQPVSQAEMAYRILQPVSTKQPVYPMQPVSEKQIGYGAEKAVSSMQQVSPAQMRYKRKQLLSTMQPLSQTVQSLKFQQHEQRQAGSSVRNQANIPNITVQEEIAASYPDLSADNNKVSSQHASEISDSQQTQNSFQAVEQTRSSSLAQGSSSSMEVIPITKQLQKANPVILDITKQMLTMRKIQTYIEEYLQSRRSLRSKPEVLQKLNATVTQCRKYSKYFEKLKELKIDSNSPVPEDIRIFHESLEVFVKGMIHKFGKNKQQQQETSAIKVDEQQKLKANQIESFHQQQQERIPEPGNQHSNLQQQTQVYCPENSRAERRELLAKVRRRLSAKDHNGQREKPKISIEEEHGEKEAPLKETSSQKDQQLSQIEGKAPEQFQNKNAAEEVSHAPQNQQIDTSTAYQTKAAPEDEVVLPDYALQNANKAIEGRNASQHEHCHQTEAVAQNDTIRPLQEPQKDAKAESVETNKSLLDRILRVLANTRPEALHEAAIDMGKALYEVDKIPSHTGADGYVPRYMPTGFKYDKFLMEHTGSE